MVTERPCLVCAAVEKLWHQHLCVFVGLNALHSATRMGRAATEPHLNIPSLCLGCTMKGGLLRDPQQLHASAHLLEHEVPLMCARYSRFLLCKWIG